jgi:hypothetical protein
VGLETRARRSLRLDAAYCAGAGVLALALAAPVGRLFHVPTTVPAAIGVATLVWAGALFVLARRRDWRRPTAVVAAANAFASLVVGGLAIVAPAAAGRLLLAGVALEVAAFAAVQARLTRPR